jgi:hypothetical protein
MRKTCGSKRVEIAGKWRKLHNEQFHDLYYLPHTIRAINKKE